MKVAMPMLPIKSIFFYRCDYLYFSIFFKDVQKLLKLSKITQLKWTYEFYQKTFYWKYAAIVNAWLVEIYFKIRTL